MKTIYFSILLLCIAILTTACPKTTPVKPEVVTKIATYQIAQLDNHLASYECAANGCPQGDPIDLIKAQRIRNAAIYSLIRVTDYNYFQFENDLYVKRASGSFLADAIDMGANLAATITNGERAKTIINASLIAFRGGRKSASIHYFQEQTADVLITKMQTARNRVLADILKQLRDNDISSYPLDAALGDVIKYFYAGTLPRALQELKIDTSLDAQKAQDEVRRVRDLPERGLVTKEIRDDAVTASKNLTTLLIALDTVDEKVAALDRLKAIIKDLEQDVGLKTDLTAKQVSSTTGDGKKIIKALKDLRRDKSDADNGEEALRKINNSIVKFGKLSKLGEK
jgi:hypothetical protein